jgi:hypothetical protein
VCEVGYLGRWWSQRRELAAHRHDVQSHEGEHAARVQQLIESADFRSWSSFYTANEARRGDDVLIKVVTDDELRWNVCWLPRTTEIAAFATEWVRPALHRMRYRGTLDGDGGKVVVTAAAAVPQIVELVGRSASIEEARVRLGYALTIEDCRTALDDSEGSASPS